MVSHGDDLSLLEEKLFIEIVEVSAELRAGMKADIAGLRDQLLSYGGRAEVD